MDLPEKTVISASRRTDIPAFYMEWFIKSIQYGKFSVVNPYNRTTRYVDASINKVHTIVFWSKNFGPFLKGEYGQYLRQMGYHLYFNFTINTESALLEPNVPALAERLFQLEALCRQFGPQSVSWRFDPICFYRNGDLPDLFDNMGQFKQIADKAGQLGVTRCITSFMDHYAKIKRRTSKMPGFSFVDISMPEKVTVLNDLNQYLAPRKIELKLCCEKEIFDNLPPGTDIRPSACIDNDLLMRLFGGTISPKPDAGQRVKQGCHCFKSQDIGSYNLHPCYHNCLFCYANPVKPVCESAPDPRAFAGDGKHI